MLERNKKPLYYCRRLTPADGGYLDDGIERFEPPVLRYLNYKSLSGETSLETIGQVNKKNLIAKQLSGGDTYTENDRCYIEKKPPAEFNETCDDADYKITSVLPINHTVEIVFERMTG